MKEAKVKEIKVGIVGCGGIAGGKHLPGHKGVKGVSIVAACDIDEARAKRSLKTMTFRTFSPITKNWSRWMNSMR